MKKKPVKKVPKTEVKVHSEMVLIEHVPIEAPAKHKPTTKRQPREDANQAAFRVVQKLTANK